MGKHIRLTALLLAVSLLLNTAALPVTAEGSVAFTLASGEESVPTTEPTVSAIETTASSTEATEETTASAADAIEESTAPTSERSAPTEETVEPILATGTVVCDTSVDIRKGPGTDFEAIDTAIDGQEVEIFEFYTAEGTEDTEDTENTEWARIGMDRWICLTFVLLDEEEPTEAAEPSAPTEEAEETALATGIVVCNTCVNIRKGPGTGFEVVDVAGNGQEVEIFEFCTIEGTENTEWGRIGVDRWICLTYVILNGQAPTDPTEESTEATDPTEESTEATDPTEESTEITDPTEESSEATDPTEESSEATEPTEESSEATEPTEESSEATEPTEESTEATEPTEESSEATDPTEEATEATNPTEENPDAMPVSGTSVSALNLDEVRNREPIAGEMSLYWWAVVCGKIKDTSTTALVSPSLPEDDSGEEETTEDTTAPTNEESIAATVKETTSLPIDETIAPPLEKITVPVSGDEEVPGDYFVAPFVGPLVLDGENGKEEDNSGNVVAFGNADDPAYDGPIDINNRSDLICLSYVDPSQYKDKKLSFANLSGGTDFNLTAGDDGKVTVENYVLHYQGLGNDANPFQDQFVVDSGSSGLKLILDKPLFTALSDHATIYVSASTEGGPLSGVNLVSAATPSATFAFAALLADKVYRSGSPAEPHWTVAIQTQSTEIATPPILGTMQENSVVSLDITTNLATVSGSGYLCAVMGERASLTVSGVSSVPVVNNPSGNAGGLVGEMASDASLKVTLPEGAATLALSDITATENAGGLVGIATNPVLDLPAISSTATITGNNAGGLIGSLTISGANEAAPFTLTSNIDNLTLNGTNSSGGLFGVLANNGTTGEDGIFAASAYEITASENVTVNVTLPSSNTGEMKAGGLIGSYSTNSLKNSLIVEGFSSISSSSGVKHYGGVIGYVNDDAAYLSFSNVKTKTEGKPENFGGLVGSLSDKGHMITVGADVDISSTCTATGAQGGIIGWMPNGVLYHSAVPTLSMEKIKSAPEKTRGWILGSRGNTLVFTDATEWPSREPNANDTNDTGVWGQVLRVDGILSDLFDTGTTETGEEKTISASISENHSVTIDKVTQETITDSQGSSITALAVRNVVDFAKVALRLQLNETDCLAFAKVNESDTTGDLDTSGTITISLKASVDLNDTGLTGLTRDVKSSPVFNVQIIGTLTDKGDAPDITLPSLKVYTVVDSHDRQGLIAKAGTLTVTDLTLATLKAEGTEGAEGTGVVEGIQTHLLNGNTFTGLLAAEVSGNVTLDNVTSSADLKITGEAGNNNSRASGLIAQITAEGKTIKFTNCTWSGLIQDDAKGNDRCAGFLAYSDKKNTHYQFTGCFVKGTINKTEIVDYVSVGGLISALSSGENITLDIDDLEVDGANITATGTNEEQRCGGLLGYEWYNVKATFSNVTIKGSELHAGNSNFGGLVYKGSGYWQIGREQEDGTVQPGVTFTGTNTFQGASSKGAPSGLLVCHGDMVDTGITKSALYLEVLPEAYTISSNSITGVQDFEYFDELVGTTISADGPNNGIVSIAKPNHALIDQGTCNTQNQIQLWKNPCTRYYYNLDQYRSDLGLDENGKITGSTTVIDSAKEIVLWSAWKHCHNELQKYFLNQTPTIIQDPTDGELNLTGYSFYPVPIDGSTKIEGATITFDFENLETTETGNKKPSDRDYQHHEMHTGIFSNAINSADSKELSLTVNGLTLKGTVGGSAIIKGTARGKGSDAMTALAISNVTLDGIRTVTAEGNLLPLLINSIESFTSLKLTDVTTTSAYQSITGFTHAATSLIGTVGEEGSNGQDGKYIQLDFSQIALDGRIEADSSKTPVHNTTKSIFSDALFLQEFQYIDSNSWGVYNFTLVDDEGREKYYTLGKELSNAEGDATVRNGGEQFYFYGTEDYVYCVEAGKENSEGTAEEAVQYFASNYLPYVNSNEDAPKHQMDINLSSKDIVAGCGTYSDPYIIEYGKQLSAVAKVLNGESPKKNWKVTLNTAVLSGGLSIQDGHINGNGTGDKTFTWDGSKWVCDGQESPATADVIKYLRNAYYQLKNNSTEENEGNGGKINLSSNWGGLGSTTNPFQGVIVGGEGVTVHIDVKDGTQFGGLIKFSTGSVVKNVTIHYDRAPSIACGSVPSTIDAPFFGGVVGWCIGGDTIIDGVTVTYAATETGSVSPTITGDMAYLVPVGGYVGLVGGTEGLNDTTNGLGGGVVFRGTNTSSLSSVSVGGTSVDPSVETSYFYVNPYVGRVVDGYAVNEGSGFINTDKNYKIPFISSPGLSIDDSGNIEVSNDAGLWLLSAIVNSGAASTTANGKARVCDYGSVGQEMPDGEGADEDSGASPYLIRKYGLESVKNKINEGAVSIELTGDCNMTTYGNGFRGIGGSYGSISSGERLLSVSSISSSENQKYTITLQQNRKEYTEEYQTWTSLGTGLFPVLNPATQFTAERLVLAGDTGITYYTSGLSSTVNPIPEKSKLTGTAKLMDVSNNGTIFRLGCSGAGLLAGTMQKKSTKNSTISLNNINISGSVTGSATFAGGLIGLACINNSSKDNYINSITAVNCNYSSASIEGFACVGGFFGYAYADSISITATSDYPMASINVTSSDAKVQDAKTGVGGLIGRCGVKNLTIGSNDSNKPMVFSGKHTITNQNQTTTADRYFTGGLAGLLGIRDNATVKIENIEFKGCITIFNSSNSINSSGVLAGALARYQKDTSFNNDEFTWATANGITASISKIKIAQNSGDFVTVKNTKQGGALFGWLKANTATISDILIGSDKATVTLATENEQDNSTLSGLIGTVSNAKLTLTDTVLTRINIWAQPKNSNRGAALLCGFADNSATFNIQNTKLKDCNVAVHKDAANAGFIYGEFSGSAINGYNILIDGCTVGLSLNEKMNGLAAFTAENRDAARIGLKNGSTYTPYNQIEGADIKKYTGAANVAIFGGKDSNNNVKLVGVSVKNCNTPTKEFGGTSTGTRYAVRADYTGQAGGTASLVTTVPKLNLPGEVNLSSDGIGMTTTTTTSETGTEVITKTPYSKQIITEGATATNRTYFNVTTAIGKFNTGDYKDCISTFLTAGENTFEETFNDFPVLVINANEGSNANSIVRDYIAVLTNDTVAPRSISAATYRWSVNPESNKGAFTEVKDASLSVDNGTVSITPGAFDNQRNQFTLLDVAYNDPAETKDENGNIIVVYHLYIPVIVKKVLEFKFWASAEVGTSYWTDNYEKLSAQVVGSHGEQVTALLTFEYSRTKADWQSAVDNGENLLWNFEKSIKLENNRVGEVCLPKGTLLTLVDRNNQNHAFYRELGSDITGTADLAFSSFDGWNKEARLCDILKLTATKNPTKGKHVITKDVDEATLQVENTYYRPAKPEELNQPDNLYLIEVGDGYNKGTEGYLREQYYLTILTPAGYENFISINLKCDERLTVPKDVVPGLPTQRTAASGNGFTRNGSENQIILSNFFNHVLEVTTSSDVRMSSTNNSITGNLTATISIDDTEIFKKFKTYASNKSLYQCFNLYLKKRDTGDSAEHRTNFASGAQLSVTYYKNGDVAGSKTLPGFSGSETYCQLIFPEKFPINEMGDSLNLTLEAQFTLTYTDAGLIDQFPLSDSNGEVGIRVCGSSSLAYDEGSLEQSILRKDGGEDGPLFYREEVNLATLNYNAYDLANPTQATGLSQLGINALDSTSPYSIESAASYDVSALEGASNATELRCKLELLRKDDSGTYPTDATLALDTYLKNVTLDATINGNSFASTMTKQSDGTYSLALNGLDKDVPIQFEVNFNVLTGSVFEGIPGATYANYKVRLTAWLVNDNNEIGGSSANDYIIYTNAKILTSLVS